MHSNMRPYNQTVEVPTTRVLERLRRDGCGVSLSKKKHRKCPRKACAGKESLGIYP